MSVAAIASGDGHKSHQDDDETVTQLKVDEEGAAAYGVAADGIQHTLWKADEHETKIYEKKTQFLSIFV